MELPATLLEEMVSESEVYFFEASSPIGVPGHMHICVKKQSRILLFTACTSQTDTIYRFITRKGIDPNTLPCIAPSKNNGFRQNTFVNCNQIVECEPSAFAQMLQNKQARLLPGVLSQDEMASLVKGILLSVTVADNIKALFQ